METLQAIFTRRSIRQYTNQPVPPYMLKNLLRTGMQAPTARDTRSSRFVVIDKRDLLEQIRSFHPYAQMLRQAPLAIAICGDRAVESNDAYLAVNASAATQNILLAAHDQGLGAVWLGIYPRSARMDNLSRVLHLPHTILPISLVAVGYPAESKTEANRYDESKVHWNSW